MKNKISKIELSNGVFFRIRHNIDEMDLEIALESWLLRTNKYTAEDFCNYINSKDPYNYFAIPQKTSFTIS